MLELLFIKERGGKMRTCFIFSGVFWGAILILLGISIILRSLLNINIPFFQLLISFFFIYIGISILAGGVCWKRSPRTIVFEEREVEGRAHDKYDVVFGRAEIDLTKVSLEKGDVKVSVNTVFGSGIIKLSSQIPAEVRVNSVFAEAKFPDGNSILMGKYIYRTKEIKEGENRLIVDGDVVFGSMEIVTK